MSRAALTLHFHNDETLRNLEQAAEARGISIDDFAEVAIERELASVGAGLEGRLVRTLERLKSYTPANLEQDIQDFARREVDVEDPLRACRVERPGRVRHWSLVWRPRGTRMTLATRPSSSRTSSHG